MITLFLKIKIKIEQERRCGFSFEENMLPNYFWSHFLLQGFYKANHTLGCSVVQRSLGSRVGKKQIQYSSSSTIPHFLVFQKSLGRFFSYFT